MAGNKFLLHRSPLHHLRRYDFTYYQDHRGEVPPQRRAIADAQPSWRTYYRTHVLIRHPLQWVLPCDSIQLLWKCKCRVFGIYLMCIFASSAWWCFLVWTRDQNLYSVNHLHQHFYRTVCALQDWSTTFTWCSEVTQSCLLFRNRISFWYPYQSYAFSWLCSLCSKSVLGTCFCRFAHCELWINTKYM